MKREGHGQKPLETPGDSCFFPMSLEWVGVPDSVWTPSFRYLIIYYRNINLKLSVHEFPIYTTGKIALSFKRSYESTLKVVMLNVIEVLFQRAAIPAMHFLKYSLQNLTACINFFSFSVLLDSTFNYVWWFFSHPAAELREEIILSEPAPPTPSPVPFSPAKSATSVEVPSAPSPVSNQSPEYGVIAATTGK